MLVNTSSPASSANLEVSDYTLEQWKGPLLIQANRLIKNQPRVIDNKNLWENAWQDYANRQPPIAWKSHYVAIALALPGVMGGVARYHQPRSRPIAKAGLLSNGKLTHPNQAPL